VAKLPVQHPDSHARHVRIAAAVKSISASGTVLSVGDQWAQLANYLPLHDVTALDITASAVSTEVLQADFLNSAIPSGKYDFVVAIDVVEHILPDSRSLFLRECRRVASRAALIAFPAGPHAIDAERIIRASSLKNWREALEEHHAYGLPDLAEISAELDAAGANYRIAPLTFLWEWFASFLFDEEVHDSRLQRILFERYCSLMMECVTTEMGAGPAYRHLVVIEV
jgi:Methyltransferase domain